MEANCRAEVFNPPPAGAPTVVRWRAHHRIVGIYEEEITKEISGRAMTCRGSQEDPVVLVEGKDGTRAFKLASELDAL
jgi:hypothetical protein